jgi:crossover junction endodeoxyribonuclease RuvC
LSESSSSSTSCTILGLDPGIGITGFGLLNYTPGQPATAQAWGVIATTKEKPISARLLELYHDFTALVAQSQPQLACIEQLFYFRNATTIIPVSQARGILLLVLAQANVPIVEYTPMQIKQALTGYGKSSKAEMQQAVMDRLNLTTKPRPDDAADGLAVALTHLQLTGR